MIWTSTALDELEEIRDYIARFDPAAAERFQSRLRMTGESLVTSPDRGRPLANGDRQLSTVRPYLIRYRVTGDVVVVRSIRHSARRSAEG